MLSVFEYYDLQETPSDVLEPNFSDQVRKGDITPSYGFQCIPILEHADPPLLSELEESIEMLQAASQQQPSGMAEVHALRLRWSW